MHAERLIVGWAQSSAGPGFRLPVTCVAVMGAAFVCAGNDCAFGNARLVRPYDMYDIGSQDGQGYGGWKDWGLCKDLPLCRRKRREKRKGKRNRRQLL
jgi:hypothetical protein